MNASFSRVVCRSVFAALLLWGTAAPGAGIDTSLFRAAGMEPYPVPLTAPAFRLPRLGDDASRSKGNYRGQVVLLNFWASWCLPCRKEFPSLERLQEQFESEQFTVLAVTVADDAVGVERFLGGREVPFDILIDTTERTADAYRAAGVPVTYLLDREGRLLAGKSGPDEWDSPAMVGLIRATLEMEE